MHGIAQEQLGADKLEEEWLMALAGGVRKHGDEALADRLWRFRTSDDLSTRMAYYAHLFDDKGAQGSGSGPSRLDDDLKRTARPDREIMEQLARLWLQAAAERADDPRDRNEARQQLAALEGNRPGAQGAQAGMRPVLNALSNLRWFAPFGMHLAGRFVYRALSQVSRYLSNDALRRDAQDQLLAHVGSDTRLVIGHSLGSVVAYEALHRSRHPVALVTLGSPLGLSTIIYERLLPKPPHVPAAVTRWDNLVDQDDLVAAKIDLLPCFPAAPGAAVVPKTSLLDNGAKPHDACHYLSKTQTGRIVTEILRQSRPLND